MSAAPGESGRPRVVFVCVKNAGKSQMAAGLMRKAAGEVVAVDSAGTKPGAEINGLSAQVLQEVGVDITDQVPKALTPEMVATADLVVTPAPRSRPRCASVGRSASGS